jgi:hypothetical protein
MRHVTGPGFGALTFPSLKSLIWGLAIGTEFRWVYWRRREVPPELSAKRSLSNHRG